MKEDIKLRLPRESIIGIVILIIAIALIGHAYIVHRDREQAIQYINDGNYDEAIVILDKHKQNTYDRALSLYAEARILEAEGKSVSEIYSKTEEMMEASNDVTDEMYEMYVKYKAAKEEWVREQNEAYKQRKEADLKSRIPYVGMDVDDINKTIVGKYDEVDRWESTYEHTVHYYATYWWNDNSGKHRVLKVNARDSVVTEVIRCNEDVFWTSAGKPKFGADDSEIIKKWRENRKSVNGNVQNSSDSKGHYDVDDYDSPEDFADDAWGDEFDDWDEAYEYWEENH